MGHPNLTKDQEVIKIILMIIPLLEHNIAKFVYVQAFVHQ